MLVVFRDLSLALSCILGEVSEVSCHRTQGAPSQEVLKLAEETGAKYPGNIPYIPEIEDYIGNPHKILETSFGNALTKITDNFLTK